MFINKSFLSSHNYNYPLVEQIQKPNRIARVIAYIVCGIFMAVTFYNICWYLFWEKRSTEQVSSPNSPNTPISPESLIPESPISDHFSQKKTNQMEFSGFEDGDDDDFLGVGANSPPSNSQGEFVIRSVDWDKIKIRSRLRHHAEEDDFVQTPSFYTPLYSKSKKKSPDHLTAQEATDDTDDTPDLLLN